MINNRYIVERKIGEGRSQVFLCTDRYMQDRQLALKVLPVAVTSDEAYIFRGEYLTLNKLNHPNIIKAFEYGTILKADSREEHIYGIAKECRYIAMEYFEGKRLLENPICRNEKILEKILAQICSVLYYLHQSNYTYNDLKGENILLAEGRSSVDVRFIDFEFSKNITKQNNSLLSGTPHYLSPEILRNEPVDIKTDLYALGVLLYRMMYGSFPFEGHAQNEIFQCILNKDVVFPASKYSGRLKEVVKKLLSKDPLQRYSSSLQVLEALDITIDNDIIANWQPVKSFVKKGEYFQIKEYLSNKHEMNALLIQGPEGSGKTTLLKKINSEMENVVYIRHQENLSSEKSLLSEILFNRNVYEKLDENLREDIIAYLNSGVNSFDQVKSFIIKICSSTEFVIILDDINLYDEYRLNILSELFLIMQSRKIKIILSETAPVSVTYNVVNNLNEIELKPFKEPQVRELLTNSLASFYPYEKIIPIILQYCDLFPGSIVSLMQNMHMSGVIKIHSGGIQIQAGEENLEMLAQRQDERYGKLIESLTDTELKTSRFISSFEIYPDANIISSLLNKTVQATDAITASLRKKKILDSDASETGIRIISESLRKFIYSTIARPGRLHYIIAKKLEQAAPQLNPVELARHYELSGHYEESYDILWKELQDPEKNHALDYCKSIMLKLIGFPLAEEKLFAVRAEYCSLLYRLGKINECLLTARELLDKECCPAYKKADLMMLEGMCLIESGEPEAGKQQLKGLLSEVAEKQKRLTILLNIAYAELDQTMYDNAAEIALGLTREADVPPELLGKGFNLLGLIELYSRNNLEAAIGYFNEALEIYTKANLLMQVAAIKVNIGNIYNMTGEYEAAEEHWKKALLINLSIGNLDQEAKLLLNYGIFNFEKLNFETAIEQYQNAKYIFTNLGNRTSVGMALTNLGEVYLKICNYQASFESITEAINIFRSVKNPAEEAEAEFMLGKYYFQIGDNEALCTVINDYGLLLGANNLNEKYGDYLDYLLVLKAIQCNNMEQAIEGLKKSGEQFLIRSEKLNFIESTLLLAGLLIKQNQHAEALEILSEELFCNLCEGDVYAVAEKYLLMSRIDPACVKEELKPSFDYLHQAYELLESQNVGEITWKILFSLAGQYFDRGNTTKAETYIIYARELIFYIADQISAGYLRETFLSSPERKAVLDKLKLMQGLITCL